MIRNHGMIHGYDTTLFGLNLRLPELSAGIGKIQMKKLDKMLKIRRNNADILSNGLKKYGQIQSIINFLRKLRIKNLIGIYLLLILRIKTRENWLKIIL